MWLTLTLISTVCYASCMLFQKLGSPVGEENTECKLVIQIGAISAIFAIVLTATGIKTQGLLAVAAIIDDPKLLLSEILYAASLVSTFIAYKRIPNSVVTPLNGVACPICFVGAIVMFLFMGQDALVDEEITPLKVFLIVIVFICVFLFGFSYLNDTGEADEEVRKALGKNSLIVGVIFALLSGVFEGASSLADIYMVTAELKAIDYFYVESIIMVGVAIPVYVYLLFKKRYAYNPFAGSERNRVIGATFDCVATMCAILAYELNPFYTDAIISTFIVLSVLMSRIFLKEKFSDRTRNLMIIVIIAVVAFSFVEELV